jgi:hypothetical protein
VIFAKVWIAFFCKKNNFVDVSLRVNAYDVSAVQQISEKAPYIMFLVHETGGSSDLKKVLWITYCKKGC